MQKVVIVADKWSWEQDFMAWLRLQPENRPQVVNVVTPTRILGSPSITRVGSTLTFWHEPASKTTEEELLAIERKANSLNVRVFQPVSAYAHTTKSAVCKTLTAAKIATPEVIALPARKDSEPPLEYPFYIRSDGPHDGLMRIVNNDYDWRRVSYGDLNTPVAVAGDENDPHRAYRRFRAVVVGDKTLPRSYTVGEGWSLQAGQKPPEWVNEEIAYVDADEPFAEHFQKARKALGIDFGAFDYVLVDGKPVIREMTLTPIFKADNAHTRNAMERIYRALLEEWLA